MKTDEHKFYFQNFVVLQFSKLDNQQIDSKLDIPPVGFLQVHLFMPVN